METHAGQSVTRQFSVTSVVRYRSAAASSALCPRVSVPEWIAERYSERVAGLSAEAREAVLASRRVGQGRVATPEFWTRWALRACRDTGHMGLWAQVAHYSPRMSLEEEILGDAGGGVVKHVLS